MSRAIIHTNATRAAGRYKRKCWWTDYEDLYQTAVLAQVEAETHFDETWGRPLSAYLWRAAILAVSKAVHKASAPVSASHRTDVLVGLYRDSLESSHPALELELTAEGDAVLRERARQVRERVAVLLGDEGAEFALGVITDEWKPREVAEAHGVPVQRVYEAQAAIVRVLASDATLFNLWREAE